MPTKILIVEDEAITAMDLEKMLEENNFNVVSIASNGKQAIQMAHEFKPDIILMDIILKGNIDGIEASNKIKNDLDIPIIYLTAHSYKKNLDRVKLTNSDGFITKPFDIDELKDFIELIINIK